MLIGKSKEQNREKWNNTIKFIVKISKTEKIQRPNKELISNSN